MSVDRSKKACLRCVVQLYLEKLEWRDGRGVSIHLRGMPIFVRACVLGQLQHSKLHTPIFPVSLNQKLIFDRTLTNCRDPSLFKEVIRGEHVKIEVIQVTEDCQGGKILARYDVPSHEFLFPDNELSGGELRKVPLERSRKYQHPPELTFSTSTLLMEATIQSPVRLLVPETSSSGETSSTSMGSNMHPSGKNPPRQQQERATSNPPRSTKSYSSSRPKQSRASRKLFQTKQEGRGVSSGPPGDTSAAPQISLDTTQERLDSILTKYRGHQGKCGDEEEVQGRQDTRTGGAEVDRKRNKGRGSRKETLPSEHVESRPRKIKFKPAVPHTRHYSEPPPSPPKSSPSPYHVSRGRLKGPHDWPDCPHRSPDHSHRSPRHHQRSPERLRSHSVPHSPIPSLRLPSSPYHQNCVKVPDRFLAKDLSSSRARRSPTKTSNVDPRPPFVVRRIDESLTGKRNFCGVVNGDPPHSAAARFGPSDSSSDSEEEGIPLQRQSPPLMSDKHSSNLHKERKNQREHIYSPISSVSLSSSSSSSSLTSIPCHLRPPIAPVSTKEDLVSKYLTKTAGNMKPLPQHPGIRRTCSASDICERLKRLREQCCECLHSADCLGDDNLSEDLDRLRASLQGERDEALDRSSRFIPEESVTVKLGPRDYWSKRMAEFTGKRHRVLFDETLEKIYNRLYTKASLST